MTRRFRKPWSNNAFTQGKQRKGQVCSGRLGSFLLVSPTDLVGNKKGPFPAVPGECHESSNSLSIDSAEAQETGVNLEGKVFLNDALEDLEDASYADVQVVRDFREELKHANSASSSSVIPHET